MQAPPPVPVLLAQFAAFGEQVGLLLGGEVHWQQRPSAEQWGLLEVICHLRDVEREVHQPRFQAVIEQENIFLPGVVADEWAVERAYRQQDGPAALSAFSAARQESVALLQNLSDLTWQRQGRHAFFGPTTLQELVFLAVRHDTAHGEQIKALLAD